MGNNLNNEEIKTYIKRLVNDVTDIALALAMPDESITKQTKENDNDATNINDVSNETTESTSEVKPSSTSEKQ